MSVNMLDSVLSATPDIRNVQSRIARLLFRVGVSANVATMLALGAALERRGPKLIDYPPGILERTEAIIFFAVLAIVEATAITRPIGPILAYAMTALEVATGAQRLMFGIRSMREQPNP